MLNYVASGKPRVATYASNLTLCPSLLSKYQYFGGGEIEQILPSFL